LSKYLLEIGTEELPAKFSHSVLEQFKSLIEFELDKKLIKFEQYSCYLHTKEDSSTSRRFSWLCRR